MLTIEEQATLTALLAKQRESHVAAMEEAQALLLAVLTPELQADLTDMQSRMIPGSAGFSVLTHVLSALTNTNQSLTALLANESAQTQNNLVPPPPGAMLIEGTVAPQE